MSCKVTSRVSSNTNGDTEISFDQMSKGGIENCSNFQESATTPQQSQSSQSSSQFPAFNIWTDQLLGYKLLVVKILTSNEDLIYKNKGLQEDCRQNGTSAEVMKRHIHRHNLNKCPSQ